MRCPYCDSAKTSVVDSRPSEDGSSIRRRRSCDNEGCGQRITTYERIEKARRLTVVKRDASRVPFDPDKILRGLHAACGKRPIAEEVKEEIVRRIDEELHR